MAEQLGQERTVGGSERVGEDREACCEAVTGEVGKDGGRSAQVVLSMHKSFDFGQECIASPVGYGILKGETRERSK
eukprot:6186648-Pleurochrysis_carterae.AAC.2